MNEFGYKSGFLHCFPSYLVETQVVVYHECEVEQDFVIAGEESF